MIHFETDKMYHVKDIDPENYNDSTVYQSDHMLKRKIGLPQLTAARMICGQHDRKLFFGAPEPLLYMEHLCATVPLETLKQCFFEAIQTYHELQDRLGGDCIPAYDPIDIHRSVKRICAENPSDPIHEPLVEFNASVLKKCMKLYKKTLLLTDDPRVIKVAQKAVDLDLSNFDDIFERDFSDMEGPLDEYLEKLCILNHLFSREFELYMHYGHS